jgi:hypothetical protein
LKKLGNGRGLDRAKREFLKMTMLPIKCKFKAHFQDQAHELKQVSFEMSLNLYQLFRYVTPEYLSSFLFSSKLKMSLIITNNISMLQQSSRLIFPL